MYFVSLNAGELYYLRLLLTIVAGADSFDSLRTVNGELCHTFKKACIILGLLEHEGEWLALLEEVVDIHTGSQLRKLFKIVLSDCNPTEPELLWAKFGGKELQNYSDMPLSKGNWGKVVGNRLIHEHKKLELAIQQPELRKNIASLNREQLSAYKDILESVQKRDGRSLFLNGSAGTGKTFLYNTVVASFRFNGDIVLTVASSGIASLLLVGVRTSYSIFRILIEINESSVRPIAKQTIEVALLKEVKLIIWDEVPMQLIEFYIVVGSILEDKIGFPSSVNRCKDMKELISKLYPSLGTCNQVSPEELTERIILSARNDDVNDINMEALNILDGDTYTYLDADKLNPDESGKIPHYSSEFLQNLNPPGMPLFKLTLKIGCPVILMRNLSPSEGLCNGTRLLVTKCGRHVIQAKILTGQKAGDTVLLPRISFQPSVSELNINMLRRQFPVRVAYAMTINKSQGQSLEYVGIDLKTPVFSHGQLYVALSRCTAAKRIIVLLEEDTETLETTKIVFPEVLL
ncbi:uncharacterized protein LOC113359351 [Papaver somniferum]|uniref:uncharacterized protein LOC113359351 n=1 Tax=Papaver somniferum TaxID=3469 RepID=UPI000E6F6BAC|nr:uncharacterized protein LOC113359351 [Papaver somniferum]